ncbi:MAG: rod shape-determining protein RodA [Peptococcaceae bacterium BICA1-7]|nr:MAG: rod shape-determining protein RodA [Peptococcaceae bacterium BICA1-7]HBV98753.1 rod shape-determining protein RodA [Desulfotomaculum sp.]
MIRRILKNIDYPLVAVTAALLVFSLINIGSATLEFNDASMEKVQSLNILLRLLHLDYQYVIKQFAWIIMGLVAAMVLMYIDYEDMSKYTRQLYVINLAMLMAVVFIGQTALGAQRWIHIGPFQFQPSEFSKLIIIITFADFLAKRQGRLNSLRELIPCFIYIAVPMLLILKQPDLGTSLVFVAIMFGMLFVAGARPSILVGIIALGVVMGLSLYGLHHYLHTPDVELQKKITYVNKALSGSDWYLRNEPDIMAELKERGYNTSPQSLNKYLEELKVEDGPIKERHEKFHSLTLKEYQMSRLTTFVNPESDLLGSGYHVWQSRIAIGSGGLTGKGLLGGTQSHYTFLPIRHTDFIFSVVGEEYGFIGSALVLIMYFVLLYRGVRIITLARDVYGTLLASGIVSLFAFHVIINIAMTAGVAPVTGIPLPLFSYGGSNMLMNLAALGVLMNVYIRRQKLIF